MICGGKTNGLWIGNSLPEILDNNLPEILDCHVSMDYGYHIIMYHC